MFKNYVITAWRNIVKNGLFSIINILGLAIGLMSCILIMLFVRAEMGYDTWLKDNDRLVRMHTAYHLPSRPSFETVRSAGKMMSAIQEYAKNEIETGVRLIQFDTTINHNNNGFSEQVMMADGSFFDLFDLPFVYGDKATSFAKPMDLVVSEDIALKYFGRTDVVGETMILCCLEDSPSTIAISGVIANMPEASHFKINLMLRFNPLLFGENDGVWGSWTNLNVYTYFKLQQGITLNQLQERIDYWMNHESPLVDMLNQFLGEQASKHRVTDFVSQPLMAVTDLHLHAKKQAGNLGDLTPMGDKNMINTFVVVAGLILLIACVNFMHLSTAKASKRAREVAMRKVLGASRVQVAIQFLSEGVAIVLLALLFALVSVEIVLPFYNQLLGENLTFSLTDEPMMLLSLVLLAIGVGVCAGIYPALYLSRFLPAHILKGSKNSTSDSSNKLRTILVVSQFATSIVLVIATLVVYGQTLYANSKDVGYRSDNKLVLNIAGLSNSAALKQELLNLPEVTSVVFSSEAPTQDNENNRDFKLVDIIDGQSVNEAQIINYHDMDYGFFEAYEVKPLAGRFFNEAYGTDPLLTEDGGDIAKGSIILNASALRKFGFSTPEMAIGKTLESVNGTRFYTIVGVIPDLHFRSIKFGIRATVYTLNPSRFNVANISFNTNNIAKLVTDIEAVWQRNEPLEPINLQFLSQMMSAQYNDERITAQLFLAFAVLAVLIACLGLYGLSSFTVERRTKEIGLRKVMGADVWQIVKLLMWQFSKPVIIANLIGWPIALYVMQLWLEKFPYRLESVFMIPICFIVGLISLLIAWLTVGGNAARVAKKNPIKALRYE